MKRLALIILSALLAVILLPRCAKIVAPTGGPKDTLAPVMIRSVPAPNSTNFNQKKLSFSFNEYIQLKDLQKKIVLSPPQTLPPETRIKGKTLDVFFSDELLPNTTYTLYLADAVADNNEGNQIENFQFAFSTGPHIDSLEFKGRIVDAYTLEPIDGMLVMLYNNRSDSVPLLEKPIYVNKTNKEGLFTLSNLKGGSYKLFALADANSNYLFDQVSESIAFTPDSIVPTYVDAEFQKDSTTSSLSKTLTLRAFTEKSRTLFLSNYTRPNSHAITLVFSIPHQMPVVITPLGATPADSTWYILEQSSRADSLTFWLTSPELFKEDTLNFQVNYFKTDSLQALTTVTDTLQFVFTPQEPVAPSIRGRQKAADKPKKEPTLGYSLSPAKGTNLNPLRNLSFIFKIPLTSVDLEKFRITDLEDSTEITSFKWVKDSVNIRKYSVVYPWEHKRGYSVMALPGSFVGIDGTTNDTISFSFTGITPEQFGSISLTVTGVGDPVIVELINTQGKTISQQIANNDTLLNFQYISPENYSFRFIIDSNRNGQWDTGYYLRGTQPERVYYLREGGQTKRINVRRNWEYELSVNIKEISQ